MCSKKPRRKPRKLKSQAGGAGAKEEKEDAGTKARKHVYRFGSRNLQVVKPSEGYPTAKEAKMKPQGKLELFYAHGYHGAEDNARANLYLSEDGQLVKWCLFFLCLYLVSVLFLDILRACVFVLDIYSLFIILLLLVLCLIMRITRNDFSLAIMTMSHGMFLFGLFLFLFCFFLSKTMTRKIANTKRKRF